MIEKSVLPKYLCEHEFYRWTALSNNSKALRRKGGLKSEPQKFETGFSGFPQSFATSLYDVKHVHSVSTQL